jgi:hypothetical protein
MSLSTPSDGASTNTTGKLSVSFPARVLVEANTTVLATGTSIHTAECLVTLTDAKGGTVQVGQTVFFLQNIANNETVVHVTGGVRVTPGSYDATLSCVGDATGAEAYRATSLHSRRRTADLRAWRPRTSRTHRFLKGESS